MRSCPTDGLAADYAHQVVDHATQYVDGRYTLTALRTSGRFLSAGISEPTLAWNRFIFTVTLTNKCFVSDNRKELDDAGRFDLAVRQIVGKRITFAQLTGKPIEQELPRHGPLGGKARTAG